MRFRFLWWAGALLLAFSSPAPAQQPSVQTGNASAPFQPQSFISPNDLLLVKVFQEDDLESTLRVAEDGTISFPLIGKVKVEGKTPQEAALEMRDLLKRGFLKNPQVTLTVIEHYKRRFTILGEVQKPGSYDMPDQDSVSLLQAVGMAGGYTSIANPSKVLLKRRLGGKESIFKLNAKDMAKGRGSSVFEVLPGDVITVGESLF